MTIRWSPVGELRLLYVITSLGPGGAERSLAELLPFYIEAGIRPVVVCLRRRDQGVESLVHGHGCRVRFLPPGRLTSQMWALRRLIAEEEPDLLHTTLFDADVAGRLSAVGTGVPVLTSLVNTTYDAARLRDPNLRSSRLKLVKAVDGWTARHLTSHFHAITEAVKASAVKTLGIPHGRVTVITRGRDGRRLGTPGRARRAAARDMLGIPQDAKVVVNVARQEYQKGQRYLLEAASVLSRRQPKLVVLVSGREGHASEELARLHEHLELRDRVRFLGDRDEVPEILAAADVFAFPSVYEGLGGAVIEAMALGLPVVASDIPALREVVEDGANGMLVAPESPDALAEAIGKILDDRQLGFRFGERSREVFEERFTIERSARGMIELYHRVVRAERTDGGA